MDLYFAFFHFFHFFSVCYGSSINPEIASRWIRIPIFISSFFQRGFIYLFIILSFKEDLFTVFFSNKKLTSFELAVFYLNSKSMIANSEKVYPIEESGLKVEMQNVKNAFCHFFATREWLHVKIYLSSPGFTNTAGYPPIFDISFFNVL